MKKLAKTALAALFAASTIAGCTGKQIVKETPQVQNQIRNDYSEKALEKELAKDNITYNFIKGKLADINGDGIKDLVMLQSNGSISIYMIDRNGAFNAMGESSWQRASDKDGNPVSNSVSFANYLNKNDELSDSLIARLRKQWKETEDFARE